MANSGINNGMREAAWDDEPGIRKDFELNQNVMVAKPEAVETLGDVRRVFGGAILLWAAWLSVAMLGLDHARSPAMPEEYAFYLDVISGILPWFGLGLLGLFLLLKTGIDWFSYPPMEINTESGKHYYAASVEMTLIKRTNRCFALMSALLAVALCTSLYGLLCIGVVFALIYLVTAALRQIELRHSGVQCARRYEAWLKLQSLQVVVDDEPADSRN